MADDKETPQVDVSSILSKESEDMHKGDRGLKKSAAKPRAAQESKSEKSAEPKKAKHRHTQIEHHYDESGNSTGHTVRHSGGEGGGETSYAAKDLDEVHDGLEEHMGEPNGDEGQASPMMAGGGDQGAAPAPQAQPMPQQQGA